MSTAAARILLGLSAVLFGLFGTVFSLAPSWAAGHVDLALQSPTARADVAAIYGGLEIGLALFLAFCLVHGWIRTGLFAAGFALAGIAVVRGFHLIAYGGEVMLWASLAAESVGSILALVLQRRVGDGPAHGPPAVDNR